jgi:hypothetical protein
MELLFNVRFKYSSIYFKNMSDNKSKQDGRDRSRVDPNEGYELAYLEEKLGVSRDEVRKAVEAVGNSREKVEEYLKKK